MYESGPLTITNYDVLFSNDKSITDAHVGNNRFEVMLNLHRGTFVEALARDDDEECDRVVDRIIDIVCHKCVPNGRFLEKVGSEWICLGEGQAARERVREALKLNMELPEKLPAIRATMESPERLPPPPMMGAAGNTVPPDKSAFDKKRRRRGSLARLRRSISESMVPSMANGIRPMPFRRTSNKWKSERHMTVETNNNNPSVSIDVVFTQDGLTLDPLETYIGNNRFRILLEMQANKFASSNPHEQSCIAFDLVDTVMRHWNGKFLKPHMDGLQQLDSTTARNLVLAMLHRQTTPPALTNSDCPEVQSMRSAAVKNLKARKKKQEINSRLASNPRPTSNGLPSSLNNLSQKKANI